MNRIVARAHFSDREKKPLPSLISQGCHGNGNVERKRESRKEAKFWNAVNFGSKVEKSISFFYIYISDLHKLVERLCFELC